VYSDDRGLLQGTLDLLILKTLSWGPTHGYGIANWIEVITDDALRVEEGSLYPALHRLEKKGLIDAEWGLSDNNRKAKFYRLTATGRAELRERTTGWEHFAGAVTKALRNRQVPDWAR
jgi:PadR family transcriptional regulator PadR